MHAEAFEWVQRWVRGRDEKLRTVLDIGGRNINGTIRPLFVGAIEYTTLDIEPDLEVDIVADASTWKPDRQYSAVVCCEVFEHTPDWRDICRTMFEACEPGGLGIITTAAPGRPAHSGRDGGQLHPGEYYGNVPPSELRTALEYVGWDILAIDHRLSPADVRAAMVRPATG